MDFEDVLKTNSHLESKICSKSKLKMSNHIFVNEGLGSRWWAEEDVLGLGRQVLADDLLCTAKYKLGTKLKIQEVFLKIKRFTSYIHYLLAIVNI